MKDEKYGIERNCNTCQFGLIGVCSGNDDTYGKPIQECMEIFPDGCINWDISLFEFLELQKN